MLTSSAYDCVDPHCFVFPFALDYVYSPFLLQISPFLSLLERVNSPVAFGRYIRVQSDQG